MKHYKIDDLDVCKALTDASKFSV